MANKILLIFLSITSLAFGADSYEFMVDSPTMVEVYWSIFNAMAALFQSPQYLEILKIVFLLGGTFVFIIGALKTYQGGAGSAPLADFAKYLIVGMALLMMIFSHPSNLIIKTNKIPSLCEESADPTRKAAFGGFVSFSGSATTHGAFDGTGTVVGNIPMVLAWSFSFINEIGRGTTRLATAAFSDETKMLAFNDNSDYASYLSTITSLLSLKMTNLTSDMASQNHTPTTLLTELDAIQRDCVLIPSSKSEDTAIASVAFSTTGDMFRTMEDLFEKDTVSVYRNPTGKEPPISSVPNFSYMDGLKPQNALVTIHGETMRCGFLWAQVKDHVKNLMNSGVIECAAGLDQKLNGSTITLLSGGTTINKTSSGAQVVSMARTIGIHAALMNHFLESKNKVAPGEFSYASGKSIAEFTTSSLGTGYYMAKMLPKIQMGMRAVLYAFFPFVFIVVLLPGGFKNLVSYLQTLIWVELWMPTAAILNMFMALQSQESMRVLYDVKGLNMANSLQIFSDATQMASVAGYLYASVPALTWLILKGSGQMLGNITGAVAARMANNLDSRVINQDMQDISKVQEYNNMRKNIGLETVSLAEMDALSASMRGMSEAGEYAAKFDQMDNLSKSEYGKTLDGLLSGVGKYDLLTDKNVGGAAQNLAKNAAMMKFLSEMSEKGAMGFVNPDGSINAEQIKRLNEVGGIQKLIQLSAEGNIQAQNTLSSLIQASTNNMATNIGKGLAQGSVAGISLDAMIASGDSKLASRAQAIKNDFSSGRISEEQYIQRTTQLAQEPGAFAKMFNSMSADAKSKMLTALGLPANMVGNIEAISKAFTDLYVPQTKNKIAAETLQGQAINSSVAIDIFQKNDPGYSQVKGIITDSIDKKLDSDIESKKAELKKAELSNDKAKMSELRTEIRNLETERRDLSGTDSNKSAAVAAKYVNDKKVIADVLSNPGVNKTFAQARDLKTDVNNRTLDTIAKTQAYTDLEKAFGKDKLQAMLSASTILSTLTGAAQEKVLMGAAEAIGKVDKKEQLKALEGYYIGKFGIENFNALSGVWRNISSIFSK